MATPHSLFFSTEVGVQFIELTHATSSRTMPLLCRYGVLMVAALTSVEELISIIWFSASVASEESMNLQSTPSCALSAIIITGDDSPRFA